MRHQDDVELEKVHINLNQFKGVSEYQILSRIICCNANIFQIYSLALESLEADNFHDDPHADLVMSKKALNLFQEVQHSPEKSSTTSLSNSQLGGASNLSSGSTSKSSKRRLKTAEYYKQRYV